MFVHRISGSIDFDEPEFDARFASAMERYRLRLSSLDLSRAGDLLLYFGEDFFHDAEILELMLADDGRETRMRLQAWIDTTRESGAVPVEFIVGFEDVVWQLLRREPGADAITEFKYSEIDGLEDSIDDAKRDFGGDFHSLAIECDEGWIALVFRSVRVAAADPVGWARTLRDPEMRPYLFGLQGTGTAPA